MVSFCNPVGGGGAKVSGRIEVRPNAVDSSFCNNRMLHSLIMLAWAKSTMPIYYMLLISMLIVVSHKDVNDLIH